MRALLHRTFIAHPQTIGEGYLQHAWVALSYSGRLLLAGLAALIHAIIPGLFEKTASTMIKSMYAEMMARSAADKH